MQLQEQTPRGSPRRTGVLWGIFHLHHPLVADSKSFQQEVKKTSLPVTTEPTFDAVLEDGSCLCAVNKGKTIILIPLCRSILMDKSKPTL